MAGDTVKGEKTEVWYLENLKMPGKVLTVITVNTKGFNSIN